MSDTEPRGLPSGADPEKRPADAGKDPAADGSAPPGLPALPGITLQQELARGGMGVVYIGRQDFLDRRVAVKFLSIDLTNDEFTKRFQREAKILAGISHPNIVSCHMADTTPEGQSYLVMEFIDGPSLKEWIAENGAASTVASLRLIRATAAALAHAFLSDIIHRDVKPENVLLETVTSTALDVMFPYTPKLVDLGLARAASDQVGMGLTSPGSVMGTPLTMSPEQFDDPDSVDFRSDIYGLGCCLYEMLAGKPAFTGKKLTDIVLRKRDPVPPNPCDDNPSIPPEVGAFTQRLLAPSRDDRPATYKELDREISALMDAVCTGKTGVAEDFDRTVPSRPAAFGGATTRPSAAPAQASAPAVNVQATASGATTGETPTQTAQAARSGKLVFMVILALSAVGAGVFFAIGGGSTDDGGPGGVGPNGEGGPAAGPNAPPTVRIAADAPAVVAPAEKFVIAVEASDPDGDQLSYKWEFPTDAISRVSADGQPKTEFRLSDGLEGVKFVITATVSDGNLQETVTHEVVCGAGPNEFPLMGYRGKPEWFANGTWAQLQDPTRANPGVSGRAKSGPSTLSGPVGSEPYWEWVGVLEPTEGQSGDGEGLVAFTYGAGGQAVRVGRDEEAGRWRIEVLDRVPGKDEWAPRAAPFEKAWAEAEDSVDSYGAWVSIRRERSELVVQVGQLVQEPARAGEARPDPAISKSDLLRIPLTEAQQETLTNEGRVTLVTSRGRCVFRLERH